jgi:hypothetical protein
MYNKITLWEIKMVKIKWVDNGLAASFCDNKDNKTIELHKDLQQFPELYIPIIEHEQAHTSEAGYTKKDFMIDFKGLHTEKISRWQLYKFMLVRPSTWIHCLPFYYQKDKGFVIDWFRTGMYTAIIIYLVIFIKLITFMMGGGN